MRVNIDPTDHPNGVNKDGGMIGPCSDDPFTDGMIGRLRRQALGSRSGERLANTTAPVEPRELPYLEYPGALHA